MTAPSIGSSSFISIKGSPNPAGEIVEDITAPGRDGVAYRKLGKRGAKYQVRTVADYTDASAVKTAIAAYMAMRGTLQTVTDDLGNSWTNVAVLDVEIISISKGSLATGGLSGGTAVLAALWTLQHTEVPA